MDSTSVEVTEYDDIIDSRDVIARIADLESERDDVMSDGEHDLIRAFEQDHGAELDALRHLAAEGADYCEDWDFGVALIRDSYFQEYAEQLADDIGAIRSDATWPLNHIDWEAATRELKYDYSELTFRGVSYWAR